MKKYSFENLDVWQLSRGVVKDIYSETSLFPEEERYGLTGQLRRAVISVSCNIVEGTSRWPYKEKIRFVEIAFSSLMETLNCLILSSDLKYIKDSRLAELRERIDEIAIKLNALKRSYERSFHKPAALPRNQINA